MFLFSTQYVTVQLPANFTCDRCVLQLLRQAGEWTATGGYFFYTCADIEIKDDSGKLASHLQLKVSPLFIIVCDDNRCGGNGLCQNGVCMCNRTYSGKFCQYKGMGVTLFYNTELLYSPTDDCVDDSDCGGSSKGSCIDIEGTSRPMKQCFCNPGWHGVGCGSSKFII